MTTIQSQQRKVKVYKLTDERGRTYGGTQWAPGVRHEATGKGTDLCTDGWIHAYEDRYLAALLNPIHGAFYNPQCWLAEGEGEPLRDGQLKLGFKALSAIKRVPLPRFTTEQRVVFGIYCGLAVYKEPSWVAWANAWLDGSDRSEAEAWAAAPAWAVRAAEAAAWAEAAAAEAAWRAAEAAEAAAAEAAAAEAAVAAEAAARAAEAAEAAEAAVRAAAWTAWATARADIDLPAIARKAWRFER